MPNVPLIKDDHQPLNLPAGSIHLIMALAPFDPVRATDAPPERKTHPGAECLIFTEFAGGQVYFLAQTAEEVMAAVKAAEPAPRDWIALASWGEGQTHYALKDALRAYEGHATGGKDDGPWLKVFVERPGGQTPTLPCANTAENVEALNAALNAALAGAAPAEPQPTRRKRGARA